MICLVNSVNERDLELLRFQRLIRYAAPDAQVLENFLAPLKIGHALEPEVLQQLWAEQPEAHVLTATQKSAEEVNRTAATLFGQEPWGQIWVWPTHENATPELLTIFDGAKLRITQNLDLSLGLLRLPRPPPTPARPNPQGEGKGEKAGGAAAKAYPAGKRLTPTEIERSITRPEDPKCKTPICWDAACHIGCLRQSCPHSHEPLPP